MELGAILGPSWGSLGALLGPSWGHLGPILGPSGAILGPYWAILGDLGRGEGEIVEPSKTVKTLRIRRGGKIGQVELQERPSGLQEATSSDVDGKLEED